MLGRNGIGKTTLIDTHGRRDAPLRGHDHARRPRGRARWRPKRAPRRASAGCRRSATSSARSRVEENLTAVARPGPWTLERVYGLFPRLEERAAATSADQLSGGEQQMLAIGRALALNPAPAAARRADRGPGADHRRGAAGGAARGCCARKGWRRSSSSSTRRRSCRSPTARSSSIAAASCIESASAALLADSGAARALPRSHRAVTPIFESFATFEKSFTGRRRYPNIRATALIHKQRAGLEETMVDRMGAWRRRRVLAGMVGAAAALGSAGDPARGALGQAGAGGRHAVADGLPRPDGGDPQDRRGDHGRGDQRPERLPRPSRRVRAARRPVQARRGAQPLREADHRRQGRPDPGPLRHGADPGGDGRGPALRQGDGPEQHGHSQAADLRPRLPGDAVRPRAGQDLSQRHPRRDGGHADAAQDHGDPDLEVPLGAVHGAGHARAGREARRQGAALSRIRIGQSRFRRHRRAREGSQSRFPVGGLARAWRATSSSNRCASSTTRRRTTSTSTRRRARSRCRPTATGCCARPSSSPTSPS